MIRACPSCEQKNRVPPARLADTGVCGRCKGVLPALDEPLDVDASAFDEIVRGAKVPILVDFWASWCAPCRAVAPQVKSVARSMRGRALVLKVDTEQSGAVAARYGVQGIPSFVVLHRGEVVSQQAGAVDAQTMMTWLARAGA